MLTFMQPDYYSVIDSLPSLLAPNGIVGVVDFYVQSQIDVNFRNYTGGSVNRHVNFFGRTFWRAWFDQRIEHSCGFGPCRRIIAGISEQLLRLLDLFWTWQVGQARLVGLHEFLGRSR